MVGIEAVKDPIDFAKELAFNFELMDIYTPEAIGETLLLMNSYLQSAHFDNQSIIKATEAYQLPDNNADIEFMPEELVPMLKIEEVMVRGKVEQIKWFASLSLRAFGVRMYGVDFYKPERRTVDTLFVPLETIDLRLHA